MSRLDQFEAALVSVKSLQDKYAWSVALKSITQQLEYLIGLERGRIGDLSKLSSINIGVLAAREVEDMDRNIANQLHLIAAEVKRMAEAGHL